MKYQVLLKFLRLAVYLKRLVWWCGARINFILGKIFGVVWRGLAHLQYKIGYLLKRTGIGQTKEWWLKRSVLQTGLLAVLLFITLPHTTLLPRKDLALVSQKTKAYALFASDNEFSTEEVVADISPKPSLAAPAWKEGVAVTYQPQRRSSGLPAEDVATGFAAAQSALIKPIILPGLPNRYAREQVENYIVRPGDSLGEIADIFGVSVATILWENKLTSRSIIRPGDVLKILPTTGLRHLVKKGDTLKKIAALYKAATGDIIAFNHLQENGSDLVIGESIVIPQGVKQEARAIARLPQIATTFRRLAAPPPAGHAPSASGFLWPSGARYISQYFSWRHHAIDIAGAWQTPTYAAKAGTVETAQCGWNGGYGCYVIIDHHDGTKTIYGHHSQLLVAPGEQVEAGQTIALMGNTGKVRGRTGIHLHFEILVNGVRVNPLQYVR